MLRVPLLRLVRAPAQRSVSTAPPASPPRARRRLRFTAGTGVAGAAAYSLVKYNDEYPLSLPVPLQQLALVLEGTWRYAVAFRYLAPIIVDWLWQMQVRDRWLGAEGRWERYEPVHERTARRILKLVRAQGGVFVKTGQLLAASPVLPSAYITTLKVLMDNAIAKPLDKTMATWRDCFGTDLLDSFAAFQTEPVATASLAQVYKARLHDGREVAVKVQHAEVARLFRIDLDCMELYYRVVAFLLPEFDFTFFAKEVRRGFNEEMDFKTEVANSIRVKKQLAQNPYVVVPDVVPQLCSDRVITMEFEEGVRVDDLPGIKQLNISPKTVAQTIVEMFGQMMFIDGNVHCDPHPGNILVRPAKNNRGCQVVLLDHGTYQEVSGPVLLHYSQMWRAAIANDYAGMEEAAEGLGVERKYARFVSLMFTFSPSQTLLEGVGDALSTKDKIEFARQMIGLDDDTVPVSEHSHIIERLPRQLLLLIKTNNLLRFLNEQLGSPINRFSIMARYAVKGINKYRWETSPSLSTLWLNLKETVRLNLLLFVQPLAAWWLSRFGPAAGLINTKVLFS